MTPVDVDSLFSQLLELPPTERDKFLTSQRPAIRAELEARLTTQKEMDRLGPTFVSSEAAGTHQVAEDESHKVNQAQSIDRVAKIGRFPVHRELAKGGQGIVYLAEDPSLRQKVVVKVSRHPSDSTTQEALQQEAAVLAELDHSGLGKLIGLEFDDDNRPLVVLEYLPGQSLRQKLQTERLGPTRAAELIAKLADAMHYAHERGLVHQDLKPDNVVFSGSEPKVIDFGLARERSAYFVTPAYESVGGSPQYIAPEQAQNFLNYASADQLVEIDHRADIFALGAILYRMLTGHPPFGGENANEIVQRAAEAAFDESKLEAEAIPGAIRAVCLTAMHGDRTRRYSTAADLAAALRTAAGITSEPKSSWYAKPLSIGVIVVTAVTLAFLGGQLLKTDSKGSPAGSQPREPTVVTVDPKGPPPDDLEYAIRVDFGWVQFTHIKIDYPRDGPQEGNLSDVGVSNPTELFDDGNPQEQDQLRIDIAFDELAYAFVFALNPDGVLQPCFPAIDQEDVAQGTPVSVLSYPADKTEGFNFTDGTGPQAFFVVRSAKPLGSFDAYRAKLGKITWPPKGGGDRWAWDSGSLRKYSGSGKTRGAPTKVTGIGEFTSLATKLEGSSNDVSVYGLMFQVEQRTKR